MAANVSSIDNPLIKRFRQRQQDTLTRPLFGFICLRRLRGRLVFRPKEHWLQAAFFRHELKLMGTFAVRLSGCDFHRYSQHLAPFQNLPHAKGRPSQDSSCKTKASASMPESTNGEASNRQNGSV